MKKLGFYICFLFTLAVAASSIFAQGVPSPFTIRQQPYITSGLSAPVFMTSAQDGTNRLFIVQQGGIIRVVQPGSTTPTDFLNITSRVLSGGERGLLGLAFHPQYSTNRRFFVYYTRQPDGAIQIAEYQASVSNPNVADTTEKIIITIPHPTNSNHNGGTVAFGPDGYLYAGPGDGGSGNDPPNNAQNINQLLGKIIRIDIDNVPPGQVPPYNIPPTNPYAGATPGADEIYAIGMRNPYRFSFDRGGSHLLWAADVGQGAIEEVDNITLGGNFGWRVYEGNNCTNIDPQMCAGGTSPITQVPPIFQYGHTGGRCSITGGFVYRGTQGSLPFGSYVYADYCSGEILIWNNNQQTVIGGGGRVVGFGEEESGEIYIVRENGQIYKIVRAKASADVDGDFKTDVAVFRPSTGVWYATNSSNNSIRTQLFGASGDIAAPEDYDGDNITDFGVFRPSTGAWYYFRSSDNTIGSVVWGFNGDIPAAGDFDGDAKADFTVFRPSNGNWYSLRSNSTVFVKQFGINNDIPVAGDYDGDGKYDLAVWRPSDGVWYRLNSSSNTTSSILFGFNGDIPAPADFDGDGKNDLVVFRPSTGVWYSLRSMTGSFQAIQWGVNGDIPVTGDYDGDGKDDISVFRPSNGVWYTIRSSTGATTFILFGTNGDQPVPKYDAP